MQTVIPILVRSVGSSSPLQASLQVLCSLFAHPVSINVPSLHRQDPALPDGISSSQCLSCLKAGNPCLHFVFPCHLQVPGPEKQSSESISSISLYQVVSLFTGQTSIIGTYNLPVFR